MNAVVKAKAWESRNTVEIARDLLGQRLCRRDASGAVRRARITETEAYDGPLDLACHASKGRTARTEVMFGPPGRWYVYLIYGMHEMLNLVTGPEGWPAAVLIRGVEGLTGPGRVTKILAINRALNGVAATEAGGLWVETFAPDEAPRAEDVLAGPRVGIDYAGAEWAAKPWRFRWMAAWTPPGKVARA